MEITTKRTEINYTVHIPQGGFCYTEDIKEKGYEVLVNGEFFCYISKDEYLHEWRAFKSTDTDFIAGGLTKKELMEVLTERVIPNELNKNTMTTDFKELSKQVNAKNTSFVYETSTKKYDIEVEVNFCTCSIIVTYLHKNTWDIDQDKKEVYTGLYKNFMNPTSLEDKFNELIKRGF